MMTRPGVASLLAGIALASAAGPARAALAPMHDRVEQFRAVLATPGLANAISSHGLIGRIVRVGDLSFRVYAEECFAQVRLKAMPPAQGITGPTRYRGELGAVACK